MFNKTLNSILFLKSEEGYILLHISISALALIFSIRLTTDNLGLKIIRTTKGGEASTISQQLDGLDWLFKLMENMIMETIHG